MVQPLGDYLITPPCYTPLKQPKGVVNYKSDITLNVKIDLKKFARFVPQFIKIKWRLLDLGVR